MNITHPRFGKILFPTRVLYIFLASGCAIILVSLMWYLMNDVVVKMANIIITQFEGTPAAIDSDAHTFLSNIWSYFLVIFTFGILIWGYVYAQRTSERGGYYYG